jgi:hypothetical protein
MAVVRKADENAFALCNLRKPTPGIKVADIKLAQYHETDSSAVGTNRTNQAGPTRWSRAMWHVIICIALFGLSVLGNYFLYRPYVDRAEAEKRGKERILRNNGLLGRRD